MSRFSIALLMPALAGAQWINYPTAGAPRNADGKVNLEAPAPKLANGTPDLSGVWRQPNGVKYTVNIAADMKPEDVPFRPAAAAIYKQHQDTISKDDPVGYCLPPGVPEMNSVPYPYKIMQYPKEIVILYEAFWTYRQIFMDGRALPKDPNPSWWGYSVGHWEGDTLVVESSGFNDKTWIDTGGRPHSEQMKVTERYRRRDFGHIEYQVTIDDPVMYTKPWTVNYPINYMPDSELIEYVCTENNKDVQHLVGK